MENRTIGKHLKVIDSESKASTSSKNPGQRTNQPPTYSSSKR